ATMVDLETRIKDQARRLGFELVGIAAATEAETYGVFRDWLRSGFGGEMRYLQRREEAYRHPGGVLPGVRSLVMVGMSYKPADPDPTAVPSLTGRVARYARGADYHGILWRRLEELLGWIQEQLPGTVGRAVVDTAPLLER